MNTIKYLLIIITVLSGGCVVRIDQSAEKNARANSLGENVKFLTQWGNGSSVIQCVIEETDSSGYKKQNIAFYRDIISKENLLFSQREMNYPRAVMPLKDNAGNLLTIWESGNAYRVKVYCFINDKVTLALDESTAFYPELFYEKKDSEDLSLLITTVDLVKNKKTRTRDVQPVSATLYRWKDNKYQIISDIPWIKRFQTVK
ncbi:MAG: hypothetical protein WCJ01_08775 [Ignavibacteria bacterium]